MDLTENNHEMPNERQTVTSASYCLNLEIKTFSEQHGKEICRWNYENEYAVYNLPPWELIKEMGYDISMPEKREKEYYAVCQGKEFIGYFRLIQEKSFILAGVGLKPECCGMGKGIFLVKAMVSLSKEHYPGKKLRLVVRTFNQRAITCYQRAGFIPKGMIQKQVSGKGVSFLMMEYEL